MTEHVDVPRAENASISSSDHVDVDVHTATEFAATDDIAEKAFDELLAVLWPVDNPAGDQLSVCWRDERGRFSSELLSPSDAPAFVEMLNGEAVDVWFGVNPVSASVTEGRGTSEDITGLVALFADLDVKPGWCRDLVECHLLVDDLAERLGQRPAVIIYSGHGLQPIWLLDRSWTRAMTNSEAAELLEQFGQLVSEVAERRGCKVDQVYDLPRILRVPGTTNYKDRQQPVPVRCAADQGLPLSANQVFEGLNTLGGAQTTSALTESGDPHGDWPYGTADCPYVVAMVESWGEDSDAPARGRHQWAVDRAVRLAAAHRLGCITADGLTVAFEHLEGCLQRWCQTVGDPRPLHYDEIGDAYRWAVAKVAGLTDGQVRAELGNHDHNTTGSKEFVGGGLDFEQAVDAEVRKMRVRDEARQRYAREKEPPGASFDMGLLSELLDRPQEPRYRIQDVLPAEGSMLVVAQRKTGKTTLVLNLARSLLTAEPFLGKFGTRPPFGRVAMLNYEVSGRQVCRWAEEVGVPEDGLILVNLRGCRDPLSHDDDRSRLASELRAHGVETLIVDPFGRAYSGSSQNDPGAVGAWLVELDRFARSDVGAREVILTTHAGWNGERTRGSSALEDWADSIITMTMGTDGSRYLRGIGRDVALDEDLLNFDPETRLLSLTGAGSRKEVQKGSKVEALKGPVCDYVRANPGASVADIRDAVRALSKAGVLDLSFQDQDIRQATKLAEEQGLLRRDEGGPGKPTKHYAVDPVQDETPQSNSGPGSS
ncbi:AAA family ATPase [Mycolicibacter sinensis]